MSTDFSGFSQGTALSPRIYRTSLGTRIIFILFGAALMLAGLIGFGHFFGVPGDRVAGPAFIMQLFFLLLALAGAYALASVARTKILLYPDAIELYGVKSVYRLMRHEIEGVRRIKGKGGVTVQLIPSDPSLKKIRVSPEWKKDEVFREWISGLPDLDARDIQREKEEVAADALLGATPEERTKRNARAKKIAGCLQGAAIGMAGWTIVYPHPYQWVAGLNAGLPCLAIALMFLSPGVYRINMNRANVRPSLALVFIVPAIALLLHGSAGFHLVNWKDPLPLAAIGIAVFACLFFLADQTIRSKPKALLLYSLGMAAYGYGAGVSANAIFDNSQAQIFKPVVTGKRVSTGKSRTPYLTISRWGPYARSQEIRVDWTLYNQVQEGQPVCVSQRQGALHMPWYVVGMCENDLPAEWR